ncbi:MAG: hypothetical protein D5R97_06415 [Candidatus Syntrophonatronum acetioxidans]|uniref:DUF3311 domain-containing protein n=1 Tax=Candidatus Syntrophonatronum acetioxidans TaxID=1795816 RepID=A0A424YD07_9FIRM|nr:MAG: hypothetical protein D5R97_06415 [Candidatus Syntrophonatronum acetioxidans]
MRKASFRMRFVLVIVIVLLMFLLHNNFWSWQLDASFPLLFGFMPFAYSYYIFYTVLATVAMYVTIVLIWPDPPEDLTSSVGVKEEERE